MLKIDTEHVVLSPLRALSSDDIDFLKDSISRLAEIWPYIASNPDNVFSHVVRGTPPWDNTIIELAMQKASNVYDQ